MNSFEGITEFIAVAESHGFSAAARRLGVSTSHVSRQVSGLEERLGTVLLARTTRKVRLTEAGHNYYLKCKELVDGLTEANEGLKSQQVQLNGTLRVSAAGEFAEEYVAPALIEFAAQHPDLNIDINFNSRVVNFVEEGIDFAIRYGRLNDSGLIARKLARRTLAAAASPEYLARHGTPTHPSELKNHSCLIANNDRWLFDDKSLSLEVKVDGRWRSNGARALVKACKEGLGICYMPRSSYGETIEDNGLVEILKPYGTQEVTTWIVYANRKYLPARARLAVQYLLEKFEDWKE